MMALHWILFSFISVSTYLRVPDSEKIKNKNPCHPCMLINLPSIIILPLPRSIPAGNLIYNICTCSLFLYTVF